jgi:hypothetical protein
MTEVGPSPWAPVRTGQFPAASCNVAADEHRFEGRPTSPTTTPEEARREASAGSVTRRSVFEHEVDNNSGLATTPLILDNFNLFDS